VTTLSSTGGIYTMRRNTTPQRTPDFGGDWAFAIAACSPRPPPKVHAVRPKRCQLVRRIQMLPPSFFRQSGMCRANSSR
jgi:hypothetical protein